MQKLEKYKGKKVCILGFGIEGRETFDYLSKHGVEAAICDTLSEDEFLSRHPELSQEELYLGGDYLNAVAQFDYIFKTPGISPLKKELVAASMGGSIITSQLEEFFEICPCKIIGVTGTKGKGTTSSIIFEILRASGRDVYLGGNIGTPALSFVDLLTEKSLVVLELSSFQLQVLTKSPNIAVVLNITSEHLDYHKDTNEYRNAKANIVRYQDLNDIKIINDDYTVTQNIAELGSSKTLYFSRNHSVDGCYVSKNDEIILSYNTETVLAMASDMKLRGRHNLENITAASLAAAVAGVSPETISSVIKNFKGLEHRLELVGQIDDVSYYNDSFSTVPETAVAALDSFSEPIVLIAGGSSKNSDYRDFGAKIATANLRALILIGVTAKEIEDSIPGKINVPIIRNLDNMPAIVEAARKLAIPGDIILLSPACASKGLFENYKDRGNQFKQEVRRIAVS